LFNANAISLTGARYMALSLGFTAVEPE